MQSGNDFRMGMAADSRSPSAHIVNVLIAIYIPDIAIFNVIKNNGLTANGSKSSYRGTNSSWH
jgi:hypothetical protein